MTKLNKTTVAATSHTLTREPLPLSRYIKKADWSADCDDFWTLSESVQTAIIKHGWSQKMGDSVTGPEYATDAEAARTQAAKVHKQVMEGDWTSRDDVDPTQAIAIEMLEAAIKEQLKAENVTQSAYGGAKAIKAQAKAILASESDVAKQVMKDAVAEAARRKGTKPTKLALGTLTKK